MGGRSRIWYAINILQNDDIRRRVPRGMQSAATSLLLAQMAEQYTPIHASSKSHSRSVGAVAVGLIPELLLGVDVEWMAPNRPFSQIAQTFLGAQDKDLDAPAFYRGWAFYEAYYKAFQRFPGTPLIRTVIAHTRGDSPLLLDGGIGAFLRCVEGDFQLCIVWHHATQQPDIAEVTPPDGSLHPS